MAEYTPVRIQMTMTYITNLHREVYVKISSDAIDILKFNLIIITAFTTLLSLLYGDQYPFTNIGVILLFFGVLLWMISSSLGWYLYSKCQYAINDQTAIFLNDTTPDVPQTPISTHFINHQINSKNLSTYITVCFFTIDLVGIPIFLISTF